MTTWTAVTIDALTSVGTTEKAISDETNPGATGIALAGNEAVYITAKCGAHGTDDITVKVYGSTDTGTNWALLQEVLIAATDVSETSLGSFLAIPNIDVAAVASGSTDNPTVTIRARKAALNGA